MSTVPSGYPHQAVPRDRRADEFMGCAPYDCETVAGIITAFGGRSADLVIDMSMDLWAARQRIAALEKRLVDLVLTGANP